LVMLRFFWLLMFATGMSLFQTFVITADVVIDRAMLVPRPRGPNLRV
jgi:hypothetical protein